MRATVVFETQGMMISSRVFLLFGGE
jgi:hypothetical protein